MDQPRSRVLSFISVTAILCAAGWSPALGACLPIKSFGSIEDGPPFYYSYIEFGNPDAGVADPQRFIGRLWDPDNHASNEGTYDVSNWLISYYADQWYFYGDLGDARVAGCPTGHLSVYVEDPPVGVDLRGSGHMDPTRLTNTPWWS